MSRREQNQGQPNQMGMPEIMQLLQMFGPQAQAGMDGQNLQNQRMRQELSDYTENSPLRRQQMENQNSVLLAELQRLQQEVQQSPELHGAMRDRTLAELDSMRMQNEEFRQGTENRRKVEGFNVSAAEQAGQLGAVELADRISRSISPNQDKQQAAMNAMIEALLPNFAQYIPQLEQSGHFMGGPTQ